MTFFAKFVEFRAIKIPVRIYSKSARDILLHEIRGILQRISPIFRILHKSNANEMSSAI